MTMPLAVAGALVADEPTDVLPDPDADGATRRLTEDQTVVEREWDEAWSATEVDDRRAVAGAAARAAACCSAGALVCGAAVAAYPWFGSLGLVLLTWVLRSGSLAASAAGDRRRVRGRKWYDGAQFLSARPGTWSARSRSPRCSSCGAPGWRSRRRCSATRSWPASEVTLAVCGTTFAVAVWTGPGGSRVRMPLARVVNPLSRTWKPWAAAMRRDDRGRAGDRAGRRAARRPVDTRRGPSAVRTLRQTVSRSHGTMSPMQHRVIIIA